MAAKIGKRKPKTHEMQKLVRKLYPRTGSGGFRLLNLLLDIAFLSFSWPLEAGWQPPAGAYAGTPRARVGASGLTVRSGQAPIFSSMRVIGPLSAWGKISSG